MNNVPVAAGPNASFTVAAYAPGQTQPSGVISQNPAKPPRVYVAGYGLTNINNLERICNWLYWFGSALVFKHHHRH